ncbi:hypothetical protein LSH36_1031g00010 [Paralvinella palmiformis]|uniref:G-protein coupled receptors family 1 profile domain-containing protein n=1 Tax=Paralvinella palmiformis TaxID=53620 RepID=A0AAD9IWG5_9ANNE|nr:hypothetical protein LSH36_1031g00010 [Paralvinella palmiformis]
MLLMIIVVFFLCWGPKLVLNVMKRHELKILHLDPAFYVSLVINLLPYIHSCINPIIYSFMSNNFRRSLRTGCRACSRWERHRSFGGHPNRAEFDMDTRSVNGHSMYSPMYTTKTTARPFATIVTDC